MTVGNCSGRLLRRALLGVTLAASLAGAQTATKPAAKKVAEQRANELTLAGLRPGKDGLERARQLYREPNYKSDKRDSQVVWLSNCGTEMLTVDYDTGNKIQVIRDTEAAISGRQMCSSSSGPLENRKGFAGGSHKPESGASCMGNRIRGVLARKMGSR